MFVSILPLSLLAEGIRRKLIARMQNRIGPPIIQPFYDIMKLWQKRRSDSLAGNNPLFQLIPFLYFLATFSLFLFLPFHIIHFEYDFILFIYVLVLSGALYVIAGFASNSPLGTLGSMRDLTLMVCYEAILTISLFTFFVVADTTSLVNFNEKWMVLRLPIASLCLFVTALVEMRITPFDTVEAETEVMGSVETEYSGRSLAFLELSKYLKLVFFAFLTTTFFVGTSNAIIFLLISLIMLFLFAFSQATTCRYRMDQTFSLLMVFLALAVMEFIRIKYIIW